MTEVDAVLPEGISASSIPKKNSDSCEKLENIKRDTVEADIKKVVLADDADGKQPKESGADKHENQDSEQEEHVDGSGDDNDNTSSNNNENSNGSSNHINDSSPKKVINAAGEQQTAAKHAAGEDESREVAEDEDGIEDTEGEDDSQITTSTDNKTAALTLDEDDDDDAEEEDEEEDDASMNELEKLKVTPSASSVDSSQDTADPLEEAMSAQNANTSAETDGKAAEASSGKAAEAVVDSVVTDSEHGKSKPVPSANSDEDNHHLSDKPETAENSQHNTSNKLGKATTAPHTSNGDGKLVDEPMDTSEVQEKANGIEECDRPAETQSATAAAAAAKGANDASGVVNLDDSDDEMAEAEPVQTAKLSEISNGPVAVQLTNLPKAVAPSTDDAVVIASDSEPEMAEPMGIKPLAPMPLAPAAFAPLALGPPTPVPTTIVPAVNPVVPDDDDDDDDCVVIEDDSPPEMIKRKGVGELDDMPASKRQRSLTPGNTSIGQLTIKDARSLMPQDAIAPNVKKDSIYPVTITSANQGPPKLVPMSTPTTTTLGGMTMNTGLSAPLATGLSFPGLPSMTNNANLLPGLTDDMFVLEAPSFIVPYIYEKPPTDNIREIVSAIEQKYALTPEDLAEADKSDEFDMTTEQNKEEKPASEDGNSSKTKKKKDDNDDSWSEQSEEDDDDDDDDSESGMRTKVLIKEASDDLSAIKGAIKPAAAVTQSGVPANAANSKPGQENYFESPLGKFFMDIGVGLVQEYVQADLLRLQKRKLRKSLSKNTKDYERAINALSGNLQASREKNSPYKFTMKRCEFCNFKSESALAMANHYETPHMNGVMYKCNFCTFEIRNATEIVYHMEAMHNIKARLIKPLPYHQCPNCGFEDNGKAKLARHQPVCAKKFRPELNLSPPNDWEAPAKIPRIKPRHGLVGTATAYQAMAAQAAAQKAALATIQAQQAQAAQARNLQAAALAAQNAAKMRARAPSVAKPVPPPNLGPMRGMPTPQRNPISTNVVLPNNYQLAAGQLVQQASKKSVGGQPSISITPLPRQNASVNAAATPSTSSNKQMPQNTGMKPGQSPTGGNSKAQFVICEICDGYIKDLEQLRNHMQWMHKVKIHPKMIYNRPPLNCQKCQFRFFTDQGLERHLLGSHGLVTSSMQEAANKGKDAGRCPICGRMYQWKLLNHVSRDHHMTLKPAHLSYKCTVCTATFGMYKQFETHVYTAHSSVAKKAMDNKKTGNANASVGNNASASLPRNSLNTNESLLKPLKINDEITIIPQPASKPRITNMESHVID